MTITFSQTARDVVTGAMRDLGIIQLTETPAAEELDYGVEQLNLMFKSLAAEGITPWTDVEATAEFGIGVSTVTLAPRPADVTEAGLVVSASYERPLTRWSAGEYSDIPNKAQRGTPLAYSILRTPTAVQMRLWPVPSASSTIGYTYTRVIEDVDANMVLDVPQMWGEAIREMLKARLTAFGPVPDTVLMRAEMLKRQLLDYDRPESYFIVSDRY